MNNPPHPSVEEMIETLMAYTRRLEKEKQQLENQVKKLQEALWQAALKETFTPVQRKQLLTELSLVIKKIDSILQTLQSGQLPNPPLNGET